VFARWCPRCSAGDGDKEVIFVRAGWSRPVSCVGGERRQRYRCTECGLRLSANVDDQNYRYKKSDLALSSKILGLCLSGISNRAIGRYLYISAHCVRLRLVRMAQSALVFHSGVMKGVRIKEPICFDGLENFAGSQYEVNNIQHAIGRDSLFTYDFNYASMNRKGRTSGVQKVRLAEIEAQKGRYNPRAIRIASIEILSRLAGSYDPSVPKVLLSDEHFQYKKALEHRKLRKAGFEHVTISSKARRNFQNILFPVNHADLRARQRLAAFIRETISFSKTAGSMCLKFALLMVQKNYMEPQFTKKQKRRPWAHEQSPAQRAGIMDRILGYSDIFSRRSTIRDLRLLNSDWRYFWQGLVPEVYLRSPKFARN
jgi:transposase-like protein